MAEELSERDARTREVERVVEERIRRGVVRWLDRIEDDDHDGRRPPGHEAPGDAAEDGPA